MSGWDTAFESKGGSGSGKTEYTKFPEGITRIRIMDAIPHSRWTHWIPASLLVGVTGKGRSVNCPGHGCPICALRKAAKAAKETPKYGLGQRFTINVYNVDTKRIEIMEQGKTFFEELRDDFQKTYGDTRKYDIRVKRKGTGQDDTSYRLDKDEEYEISDDVKKLYEEKKVNLVDYFKPHTVEQITDIIAGKPWNEVMGVGVQATSDEDEKVELS